MLVKAAPVLGALCKFVTFGLFPIKSTPRILANKALLHANLGPQRGIDELCSKFVELLS